MSISISEGRKESGEIDLNSRERIMTTLNHSEPDRVPIDLNGTTVSALTLKAYDNLRDYLGLEKDKKPAVSDIMQGTVRAREDLLSLYKIDTRTLYGKDFKLAPEKTLPDGSFYDDFGVRWKPASYYYDAIERPLAEAGSIGDLDKINWDINIDKSELKKLRSYAKRVYEDTDYCIIADFNYFGPFGPFEGSCILRGYDHFLVDLYNNKKFATALLNKLTELAIKTLEVYLSEVGEFIQVIAFGDDVGMQSSPYISPQMYREFIKPLHKEIFSFAKTKTKAKVFLHACGSVYDLIQDFIEEGVEILNPVQTSAAKMDLMNLKKDFGRDIAFWGGGIDVQKQLPFYTCDQIREEVKKTLEMMAPGGGFVFFPSHNIQPDVTPERVDCMFKAAIEYGDY